MKKIASIIGILLVLVIGGLLIAPGFMDFNQYKDVITRQIEAQTGYQVSINGPISGALLPYPQASVGDVAVQVQPDGDSLYELASVKQLDVHLELLPLLSGNIAVSGLTLVEPNLTYQILKDGTEPWRTKKIEAMSAQKEASGQSGGKNNLSFDTIYIKKGTFTYDNASGDEAQNISITTINAELGLEDLARGPYFADASFVYDGKPVEATLKTGQMKRDAKSFPARASVKLPGEGAEFSFSGVVDAGNGFEVQGETTLKAQDIHALSGAPKSKTPLPVQAEGLLTASAKEFTYTNLAVKLGDQNFSGSIVMTLPQKPEGEDAAATPAVFKATLNAPDTVKLDALFPKSEKGGAAAKGGNAMALEDIKLALPFPIDGALDITAKRIEYGQLFAGNVTVKAKKDKGSISAAIKSDQITGQGTVLADITAAFQNRTLPASGQEVLANPSVTGTLNARTSNIPAVLEGLGAKSGAYAGISELWPSLQIASDYKVNDTTLTLSSLNLSAGPDKASGSVSVQNYMSQTPTIAANLAVSRLDVDAIQDKLMPKKPVIDAAQPEATLSSSIEDIKAIKIPVNGRIALDAERVRYKGKDGRGLKIKASHNNGAVDVETFEVQSYASTSVKASASTPNLKSLPSFKGALALTSSQPKEFLDVFAPDLVGSVDQYGSLDVSGTVDGTLNKANFTSNIKALGYDIGVNGEAKDIGTKPSVDETNFTIKHSNLNKALQVIDKGLSAVPELDKPLNLSGTIKLNENTYTITGLSGQVGPTSLRGAVTAALGGAKPDVKSTLSLGSVPLDAFLSLQKQGAASAGTGGGVAKSSDKWSRQALDTSWMHAANIDLSINAEDVRNGSLLLRSVVAKGALKDGALSIEQLKANLYDGTLEASGAVTSGADKTKPLNLTAKTAYSNVNLEQLVRGLTSSRLLQAKGTVSGNNTFQTSGISTSALIYNLKGDGTVSGTNIVMEGFDLAELSRDLTSDKSLDDVFGDLLGTTFKGGTTRFDTLAGTMVINEGIVRIEPLTLDGPEALVNSPATISLPQWSIDMTSTIRLKEPEDVPALSVNFKGPLDNPKQTFGQSVLQNYLQGKVKNKVNKLIEDKLNIPLTPRAPAQPAPAAPTSAPSQPQPEGQNAQPSQQPTQQQQQAPRPVQPEDVINSVIDGLLR